MLAGGVLACASLGLQMISYSDSTWWWVLLALMLGLPLLIWMLVWYSLSQLRQAPELVSTLAEQPNGVLSSLSDMDSVRQEGLRGLYQTVRLFREQDGMDTVIDSIGGAAVLANPFFALLAVLSALCLIGYMFLSLILFLF